MRASATATIGLFLVGFVLSVGSGGLFAPSVAWAGPAQALLEAENSFAFGEFKLVVEHLTPIIEPKRLLAGREQLARALELLGLSHYYLGGEKPSRKYFEQLVRLEPERQLDPLFVPSPTVSFYEQIRLSLAADLAAERDTLRRRREAEAEAIRKSNLVVERVELRRNSYIVALLPFGAGQFQNDDTFQGALFLGTEVLAVGLSVGFDFAVSSLRLPTGHFNSADVERAQRLQSAQVISGGLALGLMAAGVVHALLTFEETSELRRTTIAPQFGPMPDGQGGAQLGLGGVY